MGRTGVHVQLARHLLAERGLRQHAFDGPFEHRSRLAAQDLLDGFRLQPAGVARMAIVRLRPDFVAGQVHLFSVDDDHVVAGVTCGVKIGLCLPRSTIATCEAKWPSVFPFASTTYHLRVMSA